MKSQIATSKLAIPAERIERSIFLIRGQKAMLDADLAELYGVETKAFNQAVRPVLVHEESDRPTVHAKDRPTELEVVVDGVEEQAVAAEGHDDVAVVGVDQVVAGRELRHGRARRRRA